MAGSKVYKTKYISGLISLFILFAQFQGCINFKIEIPDDPGWGIGYFVVSKNLEDIKNHKNPVNTKMISSSAKNIYAAIKIFNIEKKVRINWVWYGPDKNIVKVSELTDVNRGGKFLEYFVIWNSLDNKFYKNRKGGWSVVVLVDGNIFASKNFAIN